MLFYCSSVLALISILVVIWVPETLTKRKPFKFKLLKLHWVDVFEPKAIPPSIVMILSTVAFGAILTIIPDFSKHLGQEDKGVFYTIFTMSSVLSRLVAGKWSDKFGREQVLLYGLLIYGVAMVFIGWSDSLLEFYVWAFVLGIAVGNNMPTIYAWTIDMADDKFRGRALATMFIALETGIGLGGVISGYSYNNNPDNFPVSFSLTAVFLFMSVAYLLWYMKQKKNT
jgi:MFS family permease